MFSFHVLEDNFFIFNSSIFCFFFFFYKCIYKSTITQERPNYFMPVLKLFCKYCCSRTWLDANLFNDWLAGVWFFLWCSMIATFVCLVLFLGALAEGKSLLIFVMGVS